MTLALVEDLHESAVNPDGTLHHVSVSGCEKLETCERQWHFRYAQHLEEPPSGAQDIGKAGHKQLENTVLTGQDVLGPVARPALAHLPEQKFWPRLWAERKIETMSTFLALPGVPLIGGLDLVDPFPVRPVLRDYKFSSDPKRYGLTRDEAKVNLQLGVYSYVLQKILKRDTIDAGLIYLATRGAPKAHVVEVDIDSTQGERSWLTVQQRAARMAVVAKVPVEEVKSLPAKLESCFKYGGKPCAYWGRCPLTMGQRLEAERIKAERSSRKRIQPEGVKPVATLLSNLKASLNATAVAVVPPTAQPTLELEVGAQYRLVNGAIVTFTAVLEGGVLQFEDSMGGNYRLTGTKAIAGRAGNPPTVAAANPPPTAAIPPPEPAPVAMDPRSVLPADAPKSDPALAALPLPVASDTSTVPLASLPKVTDETEQAQPVAGASQDKPKRTRRTKLEMEAARAAEVAPAALPVGIVPAAVAPPAPAAPVPTPITPAATPLSDLVLYVNCRPLRTQVRDLAPWIYELAKGMAVDANALDIRLSKNEMLAFGKWEATLGLKALESPPTGAWFVYRTALTNPVIEALSAIAKEVIL